MEVNVKSSIFTILILYITISNVFSQEIWIKNRFMRQRFVPPDSEMKFLIDYLNISSHITKYDNEIRDVYIKALEEKKVYNNKIIKIRNQILNAQYGENIDREQYIILLKELIYLQKEIIRIENEAMTKIQNLKIEKDRVIGNEINKWLNQLDKNPDEFNGFIMYINLQNKR